MHVHMYDMNIVYFNKNSMSPSTSVISVMLQANDIFTKIPTPPKGLPRKTQQILL